MFKAILALGAFLAFASPAWATDYCFKVSGFDYLVVKGFKPPKPDKCRVFKGAYLFYGPSMASGSACTNAAGTTMRVSYSSSASGLAVSSGTVFRTYMDDASNYVTSSSSSVVSAAPCVSPVPIPYRTTLERGRPRSDRARCAVVSEQFASASASDAQENSFADRLPHCTREQKTTFYSRVGEQPPRPGRQVGASERVELTEKALPDADPRAGARRGRLRWPLKLPFLSRRSPRRPSSRCS